MNREEYVITPEGLADLKSELELLRSRRLSEVDEKLNQARGSDVDDKDNNVKYEEALTERAFVMSRITTLENVLNRVKVVQRDNHYKEIVNIGSRVTVRYEDGTMETYHVVGSAEVNLVQGQISNDSPVGQILMGKKKGDKVEVIVPNGTVKLQIIAID
jgi:transcription elongation factor GreA